MLINPCLVDIAYKFVFPLCQLFKTDVPYAVGDISDYSLVDVAQRNLALVYDVVEITVEKIVPNLRVHPRKLKEVRCHHYVKTVF